MRSLPNATTWASAGRLTTCRLGKFASLRELQMYTHVPTFLSKLSNQMHQTYETDVGQHVLEPASWSRSKQTSGEQWVRESNRKTQWVVPSWARMTWRRDESDNYPCVHVWKSGSRCYRLSGKGHRQLTDDGSDR